jgi:hypothetical protein
VALSLTPPLSRSLQHTLMYLSIAASGLADFARHWYPEIPAEVPSLFLATAFFSQGFILVFHLTGPDFDIRLHALLAFASFATAFSLALSGLRPDSLMACLLRCVCLLSLGSFWIQAGDLMFNRPAFDSVEGIAIAPALLCLHTAGWALLLLAGLVAVLPARGDSEAVVMREKLTREGAEAAGAAGKAHSHSHA